MKYGIEYQAIGERAWHHLGEGYSTEEEAQNAIPTVIARGGKWARRAYRVREKQATEPTHPELVRLVERLRKEDAVFGFWGADDAEAVLLGDGRVVLAVPGAPVWEGLHGDRPIGAIVSEIRERVRAERERVDKERADRAQWEKEQKERADQERADRERADQERADRERADRAQWEKEQKERADQERADQERADRERVDKERADRAQWEKEQKERAERDHAKRAQWEKEQRDQAQRDQVQRDRAERITWDHAAGDRVERQRAAPVPSPGAATPQPAGWAPPHAPMAAPTAPFARVAPVPSPPMAAPVTPPERMAPTAAPAAPPPKVAPAPPAPARVAPIAPPARVTPIAPPPRLAHAPPATVAQAVPPARVAPVAPPLRVTPAPPGVVAPVASPVRVPAPPPTVARGADARGDVPSLPRQRPGATSALAALAKLLRCGAWREGMRSSAIVASDPPDELPAGAHRALQELAGVAQPTAREIGNALKWVVDKRIDGIARKLSRRADGHGFAIWQVVDDPDEANETPDRPTNAELVRGALTGMGYRAAEAEYAVSALGAKVSTETLAELVREALCVLARRPALALHPKGR